MTEEKKTFLPKILINFFDKLSYLIFGIFVFYFTIVIITLVPVKKNLDIPIWMKYIPDYIFFILVGCYLLYLKYNTKKVISNVKFFYIGPAATILGINAGLLAILNNNFIGNDLINERNFSPLENNNFPNVFIPIELSLIILFVFSLFYISIIKEISKRILNQSNFEDYVIQTKIILVWRNLAKFLIIFIIYCIINIPLYLIMFYQLQNVFSLSVVYFLPFYYDINWLLGNRMDFLIKYNFIRKRTYLYNEIKIIKGVKNNSDPFKIWLGKNPYFEFNFFSQLTLTFFFHFITLYLYGNLLVNSFPNSYSDMILLIYIDIFFVIFPFCIFIPFIDKLILTPIRDWNQLNKGKTNLLNRKQISLILTMIAPFIPSILITLFFS